MLTLPPDSYEMLVRFFWTTFKGFLAKREKEEEEEEGAGGGERGSLLVI